MNTELNTNENTPNPIQVIQALISFIEDLTRDAAAFVVPEGESADWLADRMVSRLDGPSQRELFARAEAVIANREGMRGRADVGTALGFQGVDTMVRDEDGLTIFEGDRVKVSWLAELGVTELDCEAIGTVRYMPDGVAAAFIVEFDKPYSREVCEEGEYRQDSMTLHQAPDEDWTVSFKKIAAPVREGGAQS